MRHKKRLSSQRNYVCPGQSESVRRFAVFVLYLRILLFVNSPPLLYLHKVIVCNTSSIVVLATTAVLSSRPHVPCCQQRNLLRAFLFSDDKRRGADFI